MTLRKPSSYFGNNKNPEVNNSYKKESDSHVFAGTFDGIIESVYLKIKYLTDEQLESIKGDVFEIYSLVDNLVEHELPNYKKQSTGSAIQLDRKISDVKESLAIQLQEHILETQSTIQRNLLENGLTKYDNTISALSTDLKIVERFINENAKEIVSLKEEVTKELEKATVSIPLIEERLREIKKSYDGLESKKLLTEGGLNEPPKVNNQDPLTPLDQKFVTFDQLQKHYQLFINRIQQQMATIGGGGETQLKYLDDIVGIATNASAYDGKFLKYDHGLKKFIFATALDQENEIQALNSVLGFGNASTRGMTVGVSTFSNSVIVGGATTELVVNGDARITGILTIGTGSITLDSNQKKITGIDEIIIGTATTVRMHQDASGKVIFSDREGKEVSVGIGTTVSINTTGIVTASSYTGSGAALTGITTSQIVDFIGFATEGYAVNLTISTLDYIDDHVIPGLSTVYTTESYVNNIVSISTFSGNYTDLSNTPTALSSFSNDAGFITTSFTNTSQLTNDAGFITTSFTNTSQLTNDAGFVTSSVVVGYATETYVDNAVAGIVSSAPATLDTLNELSQALGADPNFATSVTTLIGTKASLSGATFTGIITGTLDGTASNATNLNNQPASYYLDYTNFTNVPTALSSFSNDAGYITTSFTNTNQLTNGAGFISTSFTNTSQLTNDAGFITTSFTNTSQLTNDAGFISTSVTNNNQLTNGAGYITTSFTNTNQLTNGAGFISTSVTNNNQLTNGAGFISTSVTNNNQLTNGAGYITTSFTNTSQLTNDAGFITGVSTFSGNYNDLINQPTIPTNNNELTNGAGYITSTSSGVALTGIVTSIVAGSNITISGSTGEIAISASAGGEVTLGGLAPASATATGTAGDIRYDADYIYICVATDTWKRAAISTWS